MVETLHDRRRRVSRQRAQRRRGLDRRRRLQEPAPGRAWSWGWRYSVLIVAFNAGLARLAQLVPAGDAHVHGADGAAARRPRHRSHQPEPRAGAGRQRAAGAGDDGELHQPGRRLSRRLGRARVRAARRSRLQPQRHDLRLAAVRGDADPAHQRSRVRRQSRRAFPAMRVLRRPARPLLDGDAEPTRPTSGARSDRAARRARSAS